MEPESSDNMVHQEGDYTGGLVAAIVPAKSRSAIWEALVGKHVYGTSGPRSRIERFQLDCAGLSFIMGDTLQLYGNQPVAVKLEIEAETDTAEAELLALTRSLTAAPVSGGVLPATGLPWVLQTFIDHSLCTTRTVFIPE